MNATAEIANLDDATITVQYVNGPKPGKKLGNVKDTTGQIWFIRPDMQRRFEAGESYKVEYAESQSNGVIYRHIKNVYPVTPARAHSLSSAATNETKRDNGTNYYRPTSPEDKQSMFRCAMMTAFVRAGQVRIDREEIARAILEIDAGYDIAINQTAD